MTEINNNRDNNRGKFIKGAAVLAAAGLFTKVLGAVFRLPLTGLIGADGLSYYNVAYAVYSALVVMSTAGLPIAISRMVSERMAKKEYVYAHKIFRVSLMVMLIIGAVSFIPTFFGADVIAHFVRNDRAALGLRAIAPALIFVPLFSSFRGYFNGRQNMVPTAVSEMSEQFVRVATGLSLAYILMPKGAEYAAAGATFGASAGAFAGLLVIWLIYTFNKALTTDDLASGSPNEDSTLTIAKELLIISIPIIIGSEMMPIMNLIDSGMIMRILQESGWTLDESRYMFGLLGYCSPLIALPWIVTQAVGVSMVPAVSRAYGVGDMDEVHEHVKLGYRTTMILGMPCALGMAVLALPILKLLYWSRPEECEDAAPLLAVMAFSIILSSNMQASTSVLQAVGKQMIPVRNLFIGCIGKFIVTYMLLRVHSINIMGACAGTLTAYFIAMLLNEFAVRKYTGVRIDYVKTYVKPAAATALMSVTAAGVYRAGEALIGTTSHAAAAICTLLAVVMAVIVYAVSVFAIKAITVDELQDFPAGDRLARIASKFVRK
ncbi:MAG: polysaccharide biosynthesis protein [Eubacterium sp.]|nr:polysaccharide biosynthesis protein [Eubacterium sp.]